MISRQVVALQTRCDSVAPADTTRRAAPAENAASVTTRVCSTRPSRRPGRERNHPRPRLARRARSPIVRRARDELVDDTGEPDGYGVTARPAGRRVERDQPRAGDEDNRPAALEERGRPTRDRTMRPQQLAGVEPVEPRNAVVADGEHSRPCRIDVHPDHGMPRPDDGAYARPIERKPQRVLRPGGRLDPRGLERELDPELGVAVEHGERARDELRRSAPSEPGRAPGSVGRTRRPRAPSLPRGRRAHRKRETRAAGGGDARRRSRAQRRARRRDGSSTRAPHPRGRRGRSPSVQPRPSGGSGGRRGRPRHHVRRHPCSARTVRGRTSRGRSSCPRA